MNKDQDYSLSMIVCYWERKKKGEKKKEKKKRDGNAICEEIMARAVAVKTKQRLNHSVSLPKGSQCQSVF